MTAPNLPSELLLLDTSVASEKFRGTFDEVRYGHIFANRTAVLPLPAVAELLQLPLRRGWGQDRATELRLFIKGFTILVPSETTAELWANIRARCARVGIAAGENDTWIAATAMESGCELVSYDRDHVRMGNAMPRLRVIWLEHTVSRR